jgi:hypothetical protein
MTIEKRYNSARVPVNTAEFHKTIWPTEAPTERVNRQKYQNALDKNL